MDKKHRINDAVGKFFAKLQNLIHLHIYSV